MERLAKYTFKRRNKTNPAREVIVVIPARGGSKGIANKNLQKIGKYTLLEHTIADAFELRCPIYVTTDCNDIAMVAQEASATVIRRPDELAKDVCSSEDAIIHVLETMKVHPKTIVVFMQCTSPFREPGELINALKYFTAFSRRSLFSAYALYQFAWTLEERVQDPIGTRPIRQMKQPLYIEDGSFYITYAEYYYHGKNRLTEPVSRWVHDKIYGTEIDTKEDLEWARVLYPLLKRAGKL